MAGFVDAIDTDDADLQSCVVELTGDASGLDRNLCLGVEATKSRPDAPFSRPKTTLSFVWLADK